MLVVVLLVLAIALQLLRVGIDEALHSLWAEDGPIYLQEALLRGFGHAVFMSYAGYLVIVPRLIGEAATLVPLRYAPAAVTILSGGIVALSGFVVWCASAAYIRNPYLRCTLVALTVLTPVAGLESVASAAYVPWFMLFATFWVLLWRPATLGGAVLGSLFVLATGLSTPGVWFFAPLAVLRALVMRSRRDVLILGSFALGGLAQVPVLALNSTQAVTPVWSSDIWPAYAQRVVDGATFGEHLGGAAWAHLGWPFLIGLLVAVAVGLIIGVVYSNSAGRYFAVIAVSTSLVMFVVSAYQRAVGSQMFWPIGGHFGAASRYTIAPALLLVSAALVLADQHLETVGTRLRVPWGAAAVGAAISAFLLLGAATSFDLSDSGVRGTPSWNNVLKDAELACAAEGLPETAVPTSPPGFGMQLPCDEVAREGSLRP